MVANSLSKHWCFTLNNPVDGDEQRLRDFAGGDLCRYMVYGREVGDRGTPHLQGFLSLHNRKRFTQLRGYLGERFHIERAVGTPRQAASYCKKDGDFVEIGDEPPQRGARTDFDEFRAWIEENYTTPGACPSERDVAVAFPSLFLRYRRNLLDLSRMLCPQPILETGVLNEWQRELEVRLNEDPDDRTVNFYVDADGGKGKSWFCRWMLAFHGDKTQVLGVGKRDDLAHAIDVTKSIFLFNVPRGGMEFLQYGILEHLKDRMIFSPKYTSSMKLICSKCHVVVFCNEAPDMEKMSQDRYAIIELDEI